MDLGASATGEPSKAELRRAQMLEAAAKCFNREGFHGASMASIAAEAGLSVGQIYRDFASKEAMIAALVEHNMEEWAERMAAMQARAGDPVEQLLEVARSHADKMAEPARAALTLEFLAEAARNPRIADIVREVDARVRARLKQILLQTGAPDDDALALRLDMIALLLDGWAVRAVKAGEIGRDDYVAALRPLFEALVNGCDAPEAGGA